ncbi:MAG TPA: phosphohistidine phosphatase SixA [Marinobacterium sp.]|nr:phosphohistidine phosphatase SixA [Marinobacterium sp.]
MRLILMRHAEAAAGFPDEQRQLTAYGLSTLANAPADLRRELMAVDQVFISPYLRTRQTFERLQTGLEYQINTVLVPESNPERVCELLQTIPEQSTLLLVTHMPLVGWLSGYLQEGAGSYGSSFAPAEVEILEMDYPAAGMATRVGGFSL